MPALRALGGLAPWAFVGVAIVCLVLGVYFGERNAERKFVVRFRGRARYLRWLSMSCLAVMGFMVTMATRLTGDGQAGGLVAFGLVAAVLASVYRYIVRLAYFYDARADAFELLLGETEPKFRGADGATPLEDYSRLVAILSPDAVEYSSATTALNSAAEALKTAKNK
jgi:hypothetical protein